MKFEQRIKELLNESDYKQKEIANKLNIAESNITNWKKGENYPSIDILDKLCTLLSVSADYLLGRSDEYGNINVSLGDILGNNNTVNSNNVINSNNYSAAQLTADECELLLLWNKLPKDKRKAFLNLLK